MRCYSFDDTTIVRFANEIKENLIKKLEADQIINPDDRVAERYAFILSTRGILGSLIDKLWENNTDEMRMSVVEINRPVANTTDV